MRTKTFATVLILQLLAFTPQAHAAKTYQWNEAHKHIGESATVEGTIKYTNNIGKICFLNFHPNFTKYISVIIFRQYFSLFPKSPETYYYLKKVRVHGKITEYKGKAQIKIYDPRQIEIVGEYKRTRSERPCKCNYPEKLEITSINIGQGDSTLIATPSKIMLADVGESFWYSNADALKVDDTIRKKYGEDCKCIDYVLISHFHLDHIGYVFFPETPDDFPLNKNLEILKVGESPYKPIAYGGLAYLVLEKGYKIGKMIVRDFRNHNPNKSPQDDGSKTFRNWQILLESNEGKEVFHPEIVKIGKDQIYLGKIDNSQVFVDVVSSDGASTSYTEGCDPAKFFGGSQFNIRGNHSKDEIPPSENDLSISMFLSYKDFQMFIGGDLSGANYVSEYGYRYHDMESCLCNDPYITSMYGKKVEILRANHHGSSHSSNLNFIQMLDPIVTIFSVGDHNTYGHIDPTVLDRAIAHSKLVLLTECGESVSSEEIARSKGIVVADNEFPSELEEDEMGDPNIEIIVAKDGKTFSIGNMQFFSH